MEFKPDGKYEWHGVFIPEEDSDPSEQSEFTVFADDMEQAAKSAVETIPGIVVLLQRGPYVGDESFELSDEVEEKFKEAMKRTLN
jgi:hypothetical protein